jgi:putative phosphoribosyl transferase
VSDDTTPAARPRSVRIPAAHATLDGDLTTPAEAVGLVMFAHGSGSGRRSSRNQAVARSLNARGLATLLFDLLTPEEAVIDDVTRQYRFDIDLLADRLVTVTDWALVQDDLSEMPLGYFGASTGAAAALKAAARRRDVIRAVVSRGGRADLAGPSLGLVKAPTLLIVGANDEPVIRLNQGAWHKMVAERRIAIVSGASHLFVEPGTLEAVARLAGEWFTEHFEPKAKPRAA